MNYEKKVLLLKQVDSNYSLHDKNAGAILRMECENGVCDLFLSLVDLAPVQYGSYFLFVCDSNKKLYSFDIGKRPLSIVKKPQPCPTISNGFIGGIWHLSDNIPIKVLVGKTSDCTTSFEDLTSLVNGFCLAEFKSLQKRNLAESKDIDNLPNSTTNNTNKVLESATPEYDDEAVVTENYFDYDQNIQDKLKAIKEWDFEISGDENESVDSSKQEKAQENQNSCDSPENEESFSASQKFAKTIIDEFNDSEDKTKQAYTQANPFYQTVRQELNELFEKFPQENCLKSMFPDSRWVKINYASQKYYLVGEIKENRKPKYICYGVPAQYSQTPPPQLEGYCTFIPLSIYDLHGEGFWMMFQDAITGDCYLPNSQ